jgi:poly(3-hydroxybutyrate) depolymerase
LAEFLNNAFGTHFVIVIVAQPAGRLRMTRNAAVRPANDNHALWETLMNARVRRHALLATGLLTLATVATNAQAAPLQAYNVDPASVSVSGLSSGGFMAAQLGVAYSSIFQAGFGVFAGGPFDCARNQNYTACMYNSTPSITTPNANINAWSGNQIDAKSNLTNRKIYLWGGTSDTTVGPNVMNQLKSQMTTFGSAANIKYDTTSGAAHTFPTDFAGTGDNACSSASSPYISNCSFDGAGAVLKHLYGAGLNARNTGTLGGSVVSFDQSAYLSAANGGGATGYAYVPANCAPGGATVCKLHVALHGCQQNYGKIGDKFIQNTGYNKWADTNNIVILYPQTTVDNTSHSTWSGSLANPNACWDWIGWYGANADQKGGTQMAALVAMVNKVTSGYSGGGGTTPPATVPAAPTGLSVSATTASSVSLSWSAASTATSYKIYRGGANVGTSTGTSYTDSGLTASTSYSYTVSALNAVGEGVQSSAVSGATQAAVSYSQSVTATVTTHYVAGRLTVTQYNQMGAKYGYNANMTMYLCGSTWTNSATCGPLS